MAEMTVADAVKLLNDFINDDDLPSRNEFMQISALLESQQQTIEKLKCCGNCEQLIFGRLCEVNCDERNRKDKCNKWEGVSKDD